MQVATLHCPDCGAPASPDARECGYCHARLATVKCPSCFGLAFVGMRHCPACGAALEREDVPDDDTKLACPRCSGALQPVRLGPTPVRECDGCGGLWIDGRTFHALVRARDQQGAAARADGQPAPARPGPMALDLPVRYLRCPVCRTLMNRVNFHGTLMDVCPAHGHWFDRGELQRVMEFVGWHGFYRGTSIPSLWQGGG